MQHTEKPKQNQDQESFWERDSFRMKNYQRFTEIYHLSVLTRSYDSLFLIYRCARSNNESWISWKSNDGRSIIEKQNDRRSINEDLSGRGSVCGESNYKEATRCELSDGVSGI